MAKIKDTTHLRYLKYTKRKNMGDRLNPIPLKKIGETMKKAIYLKDRF